MGLGHRGRGTLTLAGSPLPFPCTAAPASPGPAPASVGRAADTRTRLAASHTSDTAQSQRNRTEGLITEPVGFKGPIYLKVPDQFFTDLSEAAVIT